jgi:hypothetical protein
MMVGLTDTLVISAFTLTQYLCGASARVTRGVSPGAARRLGKRRATHGQYDLLKTTTFSLAIFSLTVSRALANVRAAPGWRTRGSASGADSDRDSARRAARAGAEPMVRCMAQASVTRD